MTRYFKVLGPDRMPCHGGSGQWPTPGTPLPLIVSDLIPCERGYHILTADQLVYWLGPEIWEIDPASVPPVGPDHVVCDDKHIVRTATLLRQLDTWNERTARLFTADCAEHVVHLVADELRVATDWAIDTARRFALGQTDIEELNAAENAAWAAWDAARAARDAARAAWAAWDAAWAARDAARAAWAARDAARAAWNAARDAARAAWAAWDAARAAWAAWAAWAARDAVGAAEREWQTQRLMQYLNGEVE